MPRYVAFLRAINVGGRNPVPMKGLSRLFVSLGLSEVRTFIQSGNVAFNATRTDADALARRTSRALGKWLGSPVEVMVRTLSDLNGLVEDDPFRGKRTETGAKLYVAFLAKEPKATPDFPLLSDKEGLEAFSMKGRDVFLISRRVNGRYGFPNNFVERQLGVPATSRNWSTIQKIVSAYTPRGL